jgi:Domain of unknown function (DUF4390)
MTGSFTRFSKNSLPRLVHRLCLWLAAVCLSTAAWAQNVAEVTQFRVERTADEVAVSAQMQFELPPAVEDALLKGIPMYFVAEADIVQERWYWYDKKLTTVRRQMRLAYHPLTQLWRLNVANGVGAETAFGASLNQSYSSLNEALSTMKRFSRWRVGDAADLDRTTKYKVDFRFRLDLTQLPRPFQIGAIGQSDWELMASAKATLPADSVK